MSNLPHAAPVVPSTGSEPAALCQVLLCQVGQRMCALPLDQIVETMRPLPVRALPGAPSFVTGLAIIRGVPVPVIDGARLLGQEVLGQEVPGLEALGQEENPSTRFVTLRVGERLVALAVSGRPQVRSIPAEDFGELPPLLRDAGAAAVSTIAVLDAELVLVLNRARLAVDLVIPDAGPTGPTTTDAVGLEP